MTARMTTAMKPLLYDLGFDYANLNRHLFWITFALVFCSLNYHVGEYIEWYQGVDYGRLGLWGAVKDAVWIAGGTYLAAFAKLKNAKNTGFKAVAAFVFVFTAIALVHFKNYTVQEMISTHIKNFSLYGVILAIVMLMDEDDKMSFFQAARAALYTSLTLQMLLSAILMIGWRDAFKWRDEMGIGSISWDGLLGNTNRYGLMVNGGIAFAWFDLFCAKSKGGKIFFAAFLIASIFAVNFTNSIGQTSISFGTLGVLLCLSLFALPKKKWAILLFLSLVLLNLAQGAYQFRNDTGGLLGDLSKIFYSVGGSNYAFLKNIHATLRSDSTKVRIDNFQDTVEWVSLAPWSEKLFGKKTTDAEIILDGHFFMVVQNFGLLGFINFLLFIFGSFFFAAFKLRRLRRFDDRTALVGGGAAMTAAVTATAILDAYIRVFPMNLFFFLPIAACYLAYAAEQKRDPLPE